MDTKFDITKRILIPGTFSTLATGSRVICNPPPTDTDQDFVVLVRDMQEAETYLMGVADAVVEGSRPEDPRNNTSPFLSIRILDLNFIITSDQQFFNQFQLATAVAKRLNLLDKADRIVLFQAILYGNAP